MSIHEGSDSSANYFDPAVADASVARLRLWRGGGSAVINSRSGGAWHGPRGDVSSLERRSQRSRNSSVASSRRSRSALVSRSRCRSQGF
ncbi:hypothetical protein M6B38_339800 [Iris pallida]|uniref:Uncharacterized protein n=1 Tax=Iris pallida TaxID=29817 RepID=A0AAX6GX97_IRIPA|nr:hypothetical protein M6B38_339800 [Iris pallida]